MSESPSPNHYPKRLLEKPKLSQAMPYVIRKEYKDGVKVLIDEHGDTITFFPDGGVHHEYPQDNQLRYKSPNAQ